ncbi:MAG: diguanylate cyclase [Chloroflexota bacterium]
MELRSLLRLILRHWWVIIPIFIITVGSTVVLTLSQRPIYQSTTTLLVTPSTDLSATQQEIINSLQLLSRQSEIAATYALVASSATIRQAVTDELGITPIDRRNQQLDLDARLLPGSTVITIDVRSTDAQLATAYASAVGDELKDFVSNLTETFDLLTLDPASVPGASIAPNVPLNIALGVAGGLALAVGAAVVLHLLSPAPRLRPRMDIIDPETWAYNFPFFLFRLRQEMSRTRRVGTATSLAIIDVNHRESLDSASPHGRADALVRVSILFDTHLRLEDTAARLDDMTFALLLPDTTEPDAVRMVEALRARIASAVLSISEHKEPMRANPAAGVVSYAGDAMSEQELLDRARKALQRAETSPSGRTETFTTANAGRPA